MVIITILINKILNICIIQFQELNLLFLILKHLYPELFLNHHVTVSIFNLVVWQTLQFKQLQIYLFSLINQLKGLLILIYVFLD